MKVDLTYAIGREEPLEIAVNTFGTSDMDEGGIVDHIRRNFDLRPHNLIENLDLRNPERFHGLSTSFFDSTSPVIAHTLSKN